MVKKPKVSSQKSAEAVAPHKDGALLFRAKNAENEAFEALSQQYAPMIYKLASSLNVPRNEYEDLCQEGLIALHKAVRLYDPAASSFFTFAYLCVRHAMLSAVKKLSRSLPALSLDALESMQSLEHGTIPEEHIINRENAEALLRRCQEALSPYEYEVFFLFVSGLSVRAIAEQLKKDPKSCENALTRARNKLAILLR